jgi:hypothetical protein
LIARSGFKASQAGGFALVGARYAFLEIDLVQFYEENEANRQTVAGSPLEMLVDAGDGFGEVKKVTGPCAATRSWGRTLLRFQKK